MAFYSEDLIEEVRNANDIVDIISSYVSLKRKGNNYFGLCPFHNEKTPSFSVTPEKQIFHCFGCGVGGNVIRFIMKIENLGFKEAIEFLAEKAGLVLPSNSENELSAPPEEIIKKELARKEMLEINKVAGRFFYDNIENSKMAKDYIAKRKISSKIVARFGLGFALDNNSLSRHLIEKGFKEENILATGLCGKSEKGFLYDKFKNRFMFPIFDIRGRVIAFGGRTLESSESMKAKGIPKYVNSPENIVYTKGKHLYGLNLAKKSNEKIKRILVVEGYMDVISPHQVGITNVVASLGTALTEAQGRLLRQYANEVVLSYDSDEAGQKAIMRGIDIMQSLGVPVRILQMNGAKDPDEYILKYGPERFEKLIDNSISPVQYKVDKIKKDYNFSDTSDKIAFLMKMADILSKVENSIERDVYIDKYSKDLNVGKEAIIAEIEKRTIRDNFKTKNWQSTRSIVTNKASKEDIPEKEKMILYLLTLKNFDVYEQLKQIYAANDIEDFKTKSLIKKLYNLYESGDIINKELMSLCETEEENNYFSEIVMNSTNFEANDALTATQSIIRKLEINKLQEEKNEIIKSFQAEVTEDKRRLLESRLNEINIKLAKK